MSTSSTNRSFATRGRSSTPPRTLDPAIFSRPFAGLSSRYPTSSFPWSGCRRISHPMRVPASPAPTKSTRRGPRCDEPFVSQSPSAFRGEASQHADPRHPDERDDAFDQRDRSREQVRLPVPHESDDEEHRGPGRHRADDPEQVLDRDALPDLARKTEREQHDRLDRHPGERVQGDETHISPILFGARSGNATKAAPVQIARSIASLTRNQTRPSCTERVILGRFLLLNMTGGYRRRDFRPKARPRGSVYPACAVGKTQLLNVRHPRPVQGNVSARRRTADHV